MINMNELMKNKIDYENNTMQDLAIEIVKYTRNVFDCLVYDKAGEINETRLNIDRMLTMYGDRTGYEVACNEIRMEKLSTMQINNLLIELDKEFAKKYSRRIVIYIQELEDSTELRFHSFREGEKLWLSGNLDEYDVPILCYIS